jgi:hypothetical protein
MPAVKRRLFNVLAAVSLVLCVSAVFLWISSYRYGARAERITPQRGMAVGTFVGGFYLASWPNPIVSQTRLTFSTCRWDVPYRSADGMSVIVSSPPDVSWRKLGFGVVSDTVGRSVFVPFWFVACVLAVPPVVAARRSIRLRRRRRHDQCAKCGYDMRATPERCPECGTAALPRAVGCPP